MSGSAGAVLDPMAMGLPPQDFDMIVRHAERFSRSSDAMHIWATRAKECVDFFEGKQWSEADLHKLKEEGRPSLTINKLKPLVNLALGYHLNNQTQFNYLAGNDGTGTADVARVITTVSSQINEMNQMPFVDTECYMDGIVAGRGYLDCRMDFNKNMFGAAKWSAVDPFTVYLDPDANEYDLNSGNYVDVSRWVSVDEVEFFYGVQAANMVRPLVNGMTFSQFPTSLYTSAEEIAPWRNFGGDQDNPASWRIYTDQFYGWVDTYRKTVRLLDIQHYVRTWRWFFVDLETGDQKAVPDDWSEDRVQKVLMWAKMNNEPLVLQRKQTRRLRWTHMVGDVMVFDRWSPYDTMSIIPYFPYFRRGQTRGMVDDLVDPQREINVRRSHRQNIIGRAANGGWKYAKGSLDSQQKRNLEQFGGKPGINIEYDTRQGQLPSPEQIQPQQAPVSVEQLEKEAANDMKEISGINDSALGQIDQATLSGVAIQARQQQTVIGLEGFNSNWHRTKHLGGRKQLEIIQNFYTEPRIVRAVGVNGGNPVEVAINQKSAAGVINDVTVGNYSVALDDTTLSKSFLAGQFEELMNMKQMGMPIPDDFIIDASSIGRKEELRAALAQQRQQQAAAAAAAAAAGQPPGAGAPGGGGMPGSGPGGSKTGPDGGSLPNGPEPGAPVPAHP